MPSFQSITRAASLVPVPITYWRFEKSKVCAEASPASHKAAAQIKPAMIFFINLNVNDSRYLRRLIPNANAAPRTSIPTVPGSGTVAPARELLILTAFKSISPPLATPLNRM